MGSETSRRLELCLASDFSKTTAKPNRFNRNVLAKQKARKPGDDEWHFIVFFFL